jgi:hypothetical protein
LSRKEIIESVKESLMNLQLEYVDLVIIHKSDPNCPMEGGLYIFHTWGVKVFQSRDPNCPKAGRWVFGTAGKTPNCPMVDGYG